MPDFPSMFDVAKIGEIALMVAMIVQYVKGKIPTYLIKPYLQIVLGVAFSYAMTVYPMPTMPPLSELNWLQIAVNGLLGGIGADFGYGFLSSKQSPAFSLPSSS